MARSKTRKYKCDAIQVGNIYGDFVVLSVSRDPTLVTVKCRMCETEQTDLPPHYLYKKADGVARGCYACWRQHKKVVRVTEEEMQERRKAYWAKARRAAKRKMLEDPEYAAKKAAQRQGQYERAAKRRASKDGWAKDRLNHLKHRAMKAGVPWESDAYEGLLLPDTCPVLGIPLFKGEGHLTMNSPSIDRIVPAKGYVKGNLQIISQLANGMKQNATKEQLISFAKWVLSRYEDVSSATYES